MAVAAASGKGNVMEGLSVKLQASVVATGSVVSAVAGVVVEAVAVFAIFFG